MKLTEFIKKLKHIASLPTTYYSVAGGDWAKWNGSKWNFDCVILIKAILWGWCENKKHSHGGAIYNSNGVKDDNADGIIKRCSNVSSDFSKIEVGELLWMNGHVGVYIGNNDVIECTAAWERKVLYSKIDSKGRRTRNGVQVGYWLKHGKLPYIDYSCEVVSKSIDELAQEVIDGKWGNNPERKERLTKAGYDYAKVQARVNEILASKKTKTYIVNKGDTLSSIARKFNTSIQNIYNANKTLIDNENKKRGVATAKMWVYPGQKLVIEV